MITPAKRPPARALKPPPGAAMPSQHELQLPDLVEFRRSEGQIRFHNERVVVISAAAIGVLRRELIASLGLEAARRLLFRFGFTNGYRDAVSLRAGFPWARPPRRRANGRHAARESRASCTPTSCACPGIRRRTASRPSALWRHSYEAEQHLQQCGPAAEPACWTLCGYASGFASACLGREVYFRETQCAAVLRLPLCRRRQGRRRAGETSGNGCVTSTAPRRCSPSSSSRAGSAPAEAASRAAGNAVAPATPANSTCSGRGLISTRAARR